MILRPRQQEIQLDAGRDAIFRRLRATHPQALLLDGSGGFADAWAQGALVALEPKLCLLADRSRGVGPPEPLAALAALLRERRECGGEQTGLVALMGYELLGGNGAGRDALPELMVLAVDQSLRFLGSGRAVLTLRLPAGGEQDRYRRMLDLAGEPAPPSAAQAVGRPRTSLPREAYLAAVKRIKRHIERGDIYQANLCQRIVVEHLGDSLELFFELARRTPAPRSAFVQVAQFALGSVSPETFVHMSPGGTIETLPIKGTRPRGRTEQADAAAAQELLGSEKDRAELLMVVDMERNDLSRVCRPGTVRVMEFATLRSFAAVHHLVARIAGQLQPEVDARALIQATFPGGSISGAPKIRAIEILQQLESVRRNFFTGALFWFGDDGSVESSILIRSVLFDGQRAIVGAGGGIVADSDPEQEWQESNLKARALCQALGFEPEEAA